MNGGLALISQRRMPWRALTILALIVLFVIAPAFAPYDPMATAPTDQFLPPSAAHWLGTDQFGRDVLSRLLHGGQRTLAIALIAALLALSVGIPLGLLAAWQPASGRGAALSWLPSLLNSLIEALFAIPGLLLGLVTITLIGSGPLPVAIAAGISQIAPVARLIQVAGRGALISPYVEAARAIGADEARVLFRHALPNIAGQIAAASVLAFSYSLLNSAALSFLGLGGALGDPDWGAMLYDGRQAFRIAPWVGIAPGIAITLMVWVADRLGTRLTTRNNGGG
ncbi:MAG: ABC transporter permease [Anaerolineae bacterium]|nr:ABC transporter permease [Anaerolineae bacterium]